MDLCNEAGSGVAEVFSVACDVALGYRVLVTVWAIER